MSGPFKKIAVVQGMPSAQVQDLFHTLVGRWQPSARLAGVVAEDHGLADRACSAGFLRSLGNGQRFPIFQDLGPGSTTCRESSRHPRSARRPRSSTPTAD